MNFTKTVSQATVKNCQREGMGAYYDPYSRVKCDDWAIDAADRSELATIAAQHGATRFVFEDDRVIFYEGTDGVTKTRVQFIDHRDPVAVEAPAVEDDYTEEQQDADAAYLASTAWMFATDLERRTDDLLGNLGRLAPVGPDDAS